MNVVVFGALGRVGKSVAALAKARGYGVWEIDNGYESSPLESVDVVIDFSAASATKRVVELCKNLCCPLVTGTTGRNEEEQRLIEELKKRVAVVEKANFSRGAQAMSEIAKILAKALPDFDVEIVETHRNGKADSPSGTAKAIAGCISREKGSFSTVTVHSLRCGSNFGRHEIVFGGRGESLTITHQAENVEIFALGVLNEAEKLCSGVPFALGFDFCEICKCSQKEHPRSINNKDNTN